jgi:hypothetical protein
VQLVKRIADIRGMSIFGKDGEESFIAKLEKALNRPLFRQKPGPKRENSLK